MGQEHSSIWTECIPGVLIVIIDMRIDMIRLLVAAIVHFVESLLKAPWFSVRSGKAHFSALCTAVPLKWESQSPPYQFPEELVQTCRSRARCMVSVQVETGLSVEVNAGAARAIVGEVTVYV